MLCRYDEVLQELSSSRMELNGKCSQHALDLETMKAKQKNKTSLVGHNLTQQWHISDQILIFGGRKFAAPSFGKKVENCAVAL